MEWRSVAAAVVVLALLLAGAQLAFTDVGKAYGSHFAQPQRLDVVDVATQGHVADLAAAGDGDRGAVAWVVQTDEGSRIELARVHTADGEPTVADHEVVYRTDHRLDAVAVAVRGERVAVAADRADAAGVVLRTFPDDETTVFAANATRTVEAGVTLAASGPVVGWQEYRNGSYHAVAARSPGAVRDVGSPTGGVGVPAMAAGDGVGVVWYDHGDLTARAALGTADGGLAFDRRASLGRARVVGSFGGQGTMAMDAAGTPAGVRAVWLDAGTVRTATVGWDGTVGDRATFGPGDRPNVAAADDGWLAAWLTDSATGGIDVTYRYHGPDGDTTGIASRLQSDANHPTPLFAGGPGLAWVERADTDTVYLSAYDDRMTTDPLTRLRTQPQLFAFYGLVAAAIGVILTPVMPWHAVTGFLAFYATSVSFQRRLRRWVAGRAADERAAHDRLNERLGAVPGWGWLAAFVAVDTLLFATMLPASVTVTAIAFSHPLGTSALAAAGTAAVVAVSPRRSVWWPIVLFAYYQTVLLWTTAVPTIL